MIRQMMQWAACLAAVVIVEGCCPCRKHRTEPRPLVGTEWQLTQLGGRPFDAKGESFTVSFDAAGRLAGVGACNRLMADYTATDDGALRIGAIASTRMLCPGDGGEEQAFVEALMRTTHYEIDGAMLLLLNNGELHAILEARTAEKAVEAPETTTER